MHRPVAPARPDGQGEAHLTLDRRRRICAYVQKRGAANVAELAELLHVAPNTIRRDLAALAAEGQITRSHGGAVANEPPFARLPYTSVSGRHSEQKGWIAEAALALLPETGSVFLADGTTVQALAMRIPRSAGIHVVTNSVKIAARLALETQVTVELLGGNVRPELLATDCSLASEALEMLYWDVAFIGGAALDVEAGITERDAQEAVRQRKFIARATRVVALCDSSKLGRCSYARVGPISLLDTIVTDSGAAEEDIQEFREAGVEVLVASAPDAGGR